jgi:predicted metal-dependent TIM-barrel fold hydrolase
LVIFQEQMEIAIKHRQLVLIHTPHLRDKLKGTKLTLDLLRELRADPARVWIDHVEEHTIKSVLDAGYWAGMTLYPTTKMSPRRAVDMLETYGTDRLLVNSSADWGPSSPFTLQECAIEYRDRGHTEQELIEVFHNNPARFLGQNPKFDIQPITISLQTPPIRGTQFEPMKWNTTHGQQK